MKNQDLKAFTESQLERVVIYLETRSFAVLLTESEEQRLSEAKQLLASLETNLLKTKTK